MRVMRVIPREGIRCSMFYVLCSVTPGDQRTRRPANQETSGPADQRTSRPEDQRTRRQADQKTSGPADQRLTGPFPRGHASPLPRAERVDRLFGFHLPDKDTRLRARFEDNTALDVADPTGSFGFAEPAAPQRAGSARLTVLVGG